MNYIKTNHLSLLIIAFLVLSNLFGGSGQSLGALDRTTVSNPWTFGGAVTMSATTTLSDTVNFDNPGICINFYATSTATRLHMIASTTATLPNGAAAVMVAGYGACAL